MLITIIDCFFFSVRLHAGFLDSALFFFGTNRRNRLPIRRRFFVLFASGLRRSACKILCILLHFFKSQFIPLDQNKKQRYFFLNAAYITRFHIIFLKK
jgi:hypothetical protein